MKSAAEKMARPRLSILLATVTLALSCYIGQVLSTQTTIDGHHTLPSNTNNWSELQKRNLQSLARDGDLKNGKISAVFKRSIATLAKNGQLPTLQAPEEDEDTANEEKRNIASIAKLRSIYGYKRNLASLARNGYQSGKRNTFDDYFYSSNNKRNIGSIARNGYIGKRDSTALEEESYYPFYQNSVPPLQDENPWDYNDIYEVPIYPYPSDRDFEKKNAAALLRQGQYYNSYNGLENDDALNIDEGKRGSMGLPMHGLFKNVNGRSFTPNYYGIKKSIMMQSKNIPQYSQYQTGYGRRLPDDNSFAENYSTADKRYLEGGALPETEDLSMPSKRHIGSLARLGWLPSFRSGGGGGYSRFGRGRQLLVDLDRYRKHSSIPDYGVGKYSISAKASHYTGLPSPPLLAYEDQAHNQRGGSQLKSIQAFKPSFYPYTDTNNIPPLRTTSPSPHYKHHHSKANFQKNVWTSNKQKATKYYKFRSMVFPSSSDFQSPSEKRYLILPAVDNTMLRKNYPHNNLPGRRKNE